MSGVRDYSIRNMQQFCFKLKNKYINVFIRILVRIPVFSPVEKFTAFYETQRFITAPSTALRLSSTQIPQVFRHSA